MEFNHPLFAHLRRLAHMAYVQQLSTHRFLELRMRIYIARLFVLALDKSARNFVYLSEITPGTQKILHSGTRFPDRKKIVKRFLAVAFGTVSRTKIYVHDIYRILEKEFTQRFTHVMSNPIAYRPWVHSANRKKRNLSALQFFPSDILNIIIPYISGPAYNWLHSTTRTDNAEVINFFVGIEENRVIGWLPQVDNLICHYQLSVLLNLCWTKQAGSWTNCVREHLKTIPNNMKCSIIFGDFPIEREEIRVARAHLIIVTHAKAGWISKASEHFRIQWTIPVGPRGLGVSTKNISTLYQMCGVHVYLYMSTESETMDMVPHTPVQYSVSDALTNFLAFVSYKLITLEVSHAISLPLLGEFRHGYAVRPPVLAAPQSGWVRIRNLRMADAHTVATALVQALLHSHSIKNVIFNWDQKAVDIPMFDGFLDNLGTLRAISSETQYYISAPQLLETPFFNTFSMSVDLIGLKATLL